MQRRLTKEPLKFGGDSFTSDTGLSDKVSSGFNHYYRLHSALRLLLILG